MNSHDFSSRSDREGTKTINAAVMAQLRDATGGGFERVVELFLKNLPARVQEVTRAWGAGDRVAFRQATHKLKGTGVAFGADRLSRLCEVLESRLDRDDGEGTEVPVPEVLECLVAEGEAVRRTLLNLLREGTSG
ncbi:MAG: Hpt domain-containing protein [Magnetococcales bacterium]|nr:Hpt domain-containing protein [Magnetococcales bacterium]